MRAAIQSQQGQAASGKAEEEPILVCIGDDGNAAGRRLGAGPRRQRSAGHALSRPIVPLPLWQGLGRRRVIAW